MEHLMSENSCQLCAVERLNFEPTPIYCSPCGARIKRNATYYSYGSGETRQFFCILCYNQARGDTIEVDGTQFQKAKFEKKRNDEETEESVKFYILGVFVLSSSLPLCSRKLTASLFFCLCGCISFWVL